MFLKRLESVGFKSFAERISVEFVPGVTAIVGPNGSGKSNIIDAVRWVLGEQSAKSLRGQKMEDIIFQGSDTRRPLNFAEVTLVLDNTDQQLPIDYNEVSVTRRVYRSGESEFYINKQACRLKDIIDLFIDSGLGREAFSIIGQGQVEEILSSKAEERRTIFEEAAGVLKYKQRKRKAEFKLVETEENLNRVEDIIYEIEQQITPLKKQAEIAKTYKVKSELLKDKEVTLIITEISKLHRKWKGILAQLDQEKLTEIEMKTSIQKREAKLENHRQHIQKLDQEISDLQTGLLNATEQLEQFEGKRNVMRERLKHFTENKFKLETNQADVIKRIEKMTNHYLKETDKLNSLKTKKLQTEQAVQQLKRQLTIEADYVVDAIEDLKSDYIETLNEQAVKRNEIKSLDQRLQHMSNRRHMESDKSLELVEQRNKIKEEKLQFDIKIDETKELLETKEKERNNIQEQIAQERQELEISQRKLYEGNEQIAKLVSQKEMLEEMKRDFQGFYFGVKEVLKANEKGYLTNIHGAVVELIHVEETYLTAIDTVLGAQAQHIVVTDEQSARETINWLKRENKGRATFLPLSTIEGRSIPTSMLNNIVAHPGFVGIAANLVETEPLYKNIVEFIMGHVLVAKTLKDANEIGKLTMRRFRVVTLDGDVVNPGGSMSGGAKRKANQSLFTREKDLQRLTQKVAEYKRRATTFLEKINRDKHALRNKDKQLVQLEQIIQDLRQQLQQLQQMEKELAIKLTSLNDDLTSYDENTKQYLQEKDKIEQLKEKSTEELAVIGKQLTKLQKEINELTVKAEQHQMNKESIQKQLHEKEVFLAEQEERVKNQHDKTNLLQEQLVELEEQKETIEKDLHHLLSMQQSDETESELERMIQLKKDEKEARTKDIQAKHEARKQYTALVEDEERDLKEENKHYQLKVQSIQKQEVDANRLDVELENQLNHLQTKYFMSYEKASQLYETVTDIEKIRKEVEKIKGEIKRLGAVNLGAIDEYKRISERYEFLTTQQKDLLEAKNTLYSVIHEMDEEMIKRFDQTFSQIQASFTVVFKELFGGGYAELTLTDPNNLLETGIDIVARPPGKKLKTLGLLSGGEKALTAIALLFAILRVRPVPFCILDEVEAALDEANVTRFARYVKMYSSETQFIVITHRKGTMEEADVLYGVTMQESGVTRLVSVRLEDTKELIKS